MGEQIRVFDPQGRPLGSQDRVEFYEQIWAEHALTGHITRLAGVIWVLLLTPDGRLYVQKRSRQKSQNGGKYDKTVGGHWTADCSIRLMVPSECLEELGIPVVLLEDDDFAMALGAHRTDLKIQGIARHLGRLVGHQSMRELVDGTVIPQPVLAEVFVAYFNGPILFQDGESCGIETFSLAELQDLVQQEPDKVTGDLLYIVEHFAEHLVPLAA